MKEKIISPKSTSQFSNLIYTPDLTLATVNDVTYLEDQDLMTTPSNYDEWRLLDEIVIIGNGHPVIFTASGISDITSMSLNSGELIATQYSAQLYDNTTDTEIFGWPINCFYLVSVGGIIYTMQASQPFFRTIQVLIKDHEYSWSISIQKNRTGTSTIIAFSYNRILTAQEIKR